MPNCDPGHHDESVSFNSILNKCRLTSACFWPKSLVPRTRNPPIRIPRARVKFLPRIWHVRLRPKKVTARKYQVSGRNVVCLGRESTTLLREGGSSLRDGESSETNMSPRRPCIPDLPRYLQSSLYRAENLTADGWFCPDEFSSLAAPPLCRPARAIGPRDYNVRSLRRRVDCVVCRQSGSCEVLRRVLAASYCAYIAA